MQGWQVELSSSVEYARQMERPQDYWECSKFLALCRIPKDSLQFYRLTALQKEVCLSEIECETILHVNVFFTIGRHFWLITVLYSELHTTNL